MCFRSMSMGVGGGCWRPSTTTGLQAHGMKLQSNFGHWSSGGLPGLAVLCSCCHMSMLGKEGLPKDTEFWNLGSSQCGILPICLFPF